MIGRSEEYEKMFQLEEQLWWYRSLHERVKHSIQQQFGERRNLAILDAGCGTGGLLNFLRQHNYTTLTGVDGSLDAVSFCRERGFLVTFMNLNDIDSFEPDVQYDVIVCNDVFCYFTDDKLRPLIAALSNRIKPGGILVSNNNAFNAFRGEHDLAVGIIRRFVLADFRKVLPLFGLSIEFATYWSFALSPLILFVRQWQRLQLTLRRRTPEEARSDVYLPHPWVNETLYKLVRAEQKLFRRTPFGSSLFIVSRKSVS
ncbi:class I SAM-dependent DNA methyltransferase [Spirosoma aerophilum]